MALFGRDYDDNYRNRQWTQRGLWGRSGTSSRPYQGDYSYGTYGAGSTGWRDYDRYGYDRDFRGYSRGSYDRGYHQGYGAGYKSRWQTDFGDPFGDRQQHTPMRVICEDVRNYDQSFWNRDAERGSRYDYPFGYRPYAVRMGYDTGYEGGRNRRSFGYGYDRGWF